MALVLMVSFKSQYVFAEDYGIEEEILIEDISIDEFSIGDISMGDIETVLPDNDEVKFDHKLTEEDIAVKITGDEIVLYSRDEISAVKEEDGIQTVSAEAEQESIIYYGSLSGCLFETMDYVLYSVNLAAGDYLQARLTQPNNIEIDYELVIYDASLTVIKSSSYTTYLNGTTTLQESVGYLPTSDELVYIGVFSSYGGSETEPYTLDYTITTNFTTNFPDDSEPNENAQEATALTLGTSGVSTSKLLNSAIDNDWYSFTVLDDPSYDKIRLSTTSSSSVNSCKFEIYRNIGTDYLVMQLVGYGTQGEINLPAGTYFLRVIGTNTFEDFDAGALPTYNLSVVPVSRVDGIEITKLSGYNAFIGDSFGGYYCIEYGEPYWNWVSVTGFAYYTDIFGNKHTAANVGVNVTVVNNDLAALNKPSLATTYGSAYTGSNGFFSIVVYLNQPEGRGYKDTGSSVYFFDYMSVNVHVAGNSDISVNDHFYLIKKAISK